MRRLWGAGGLESYSEAPLDCHFSFHHAGLAHEFAAGAVAIEAEIDAHFASAEGYTHPCMVPIRVCPRNIAMQTRSRIVDPAAGTVEEYQKPRATFDLSSGDKVKLGEGASAAAAASLPPPYDRLPASRLPTSPNARVPPERTL